jgi:aminopeptidase N
MRRFLVVSLLWVLPAVAWGQDPWGDRPSCAHAKAAVARIEQGLNPRGGGGGERDFSTDTDVLHYKLDIELDPVTVWIGGSNTMTVRSLVDNLNKFRFRLDSVFTITDVTVDGTPASWSRIDNIVVEVTLDPAYNTDQVFDLYVAYNGHPNTQSGFGSITFRYRNGAPDIYTLSEPWYAYTWWPAKDELTDKTTADLWFTVPLTMVVASNGTLQGIDSMPPLKLRYRWKTDYQTDDYLYCIGATNYNQFGSTWQYQGYSMPLKFFVYPEDDSPAFEDFWLSIGNTLTTYSDLFGVYPFVNEKYGMLEFGWGGGMEHQTITSIVGYYGWEDGIVHELSHQWWGDNVTCATWHDIWLNEGFADYCEALWYEYQYGSDNQAALHSAMANRRPGNLSGTVYCYDISDPNRIFDYDLTYLKAGWAVHMLRHVIGDSAFFDTLAAYRAVYEGNAATTDQFRAVAESVSGRDLSWYFNEWVYSGGAPKYRWAWQPYTVDGVGYVELYVKQIQSGSYPIFTMPIDMQTNDGSGAHMHSVWNDASEEHLLFQVESPGVSSVQFDPKPWILWTSANTIPFAEGPPKIVTMNPAPNQTLRAADVSSLEIVFHKNVVVDASKFSLLGANSGPASFTFSFNSTRHAVTLTPTSALAADIYTLTVSDQIVDALSGQHLDGELVKPDGPNALPSGDGLAGGSAVATIHLTAPGDLNCDGAVNAFDIDPFVLALTDPAGYAAAYPNCDILNADTDCDGAVNAFEIDPFVLCLTVGCPPCP